jgi:hypothetical protein
LSVCYRKMATRPRANSTMRRTRPRNTDRSRMPDPILDLHRREEPHDEIGVPVQEIALIATLASPLRMRKPDVF